MTNQHELTYSDDEMKDMLRRCVEKHGEVTTRTFDADSEFCSSGSVSNRFGSWQEAKKAAGVKENKYSKEELVSQLERCIDKHGKIAWSIIDSDEDFASGYTFRKYFDTLGEAKKRVGVGDIVDCPECGGSHEDIGRHWSLTDCSPQLTDHQQEIVTGVLLGDGSVVRDSKGAVFRVGMSNRRFLEWLDSELGVFSSNVGTMESKEVRAKRHRESGFHPDADGSTYREMYMLNSVQCDAFNQYRDWYDSGEKQFPEDLSLTPLMAKMWYVSDGGLKWSNGKSIPVISSTNEARRYKFLESLFREVGFNPTYKSGKLYFYEETEGFLDWLGEPVPGFEYKWETQDRGRYERLYEEAYGG